MRAIGTALLLFCQVFINGVSAQLVADFSASPLGGCAPLQVQFLDLSQGTPTSWNWNFGNGQISTQKNPATTFVNPGVYTIKLTVTNAAGTKSITKANYIAVYPKPVVNFTVSDSARCVPFATNFRDLSSTSLGEIVSWDWDFDDGSVSNEQNPVHQYSSPGNYNISLRVTNSGGCSNTLTRLAYIKASDSIRTSFAFSRPVQCRAPETIRFTNNTIGPGSLSFLWNFGDGNTSAARSPAHTYATGGLFSVTLVVRNDLGCMDTLLLKDTVAIKNIQSVISGPDSLCSGVTGVFVNATQPAPLSTAWRFDDGTSTFGLSTARQWVAPGVYPLKMISRYSNCQDSVSKLVMIMSAPRIDVLANDSASCSAPFTVNFSTVSQGAVRWVWNFGDGDTSTLQNPAHTYTATGEYNIKLSAVNNAGCESIVRRIPFIKVGPPVITFNDTASLGGCIPFAYSPQPMINSPEPIISYLWDLGNGLTSTLANPTTSFNTVGDHPVSLTATTADGCVTTATTVVSTGNPSFVNFGVADTTQCPGTNLQFFDSSINVNRWEWTFGDGQTSDEQNPLHQYDDTGYYTVKLLAWSNGCVDSAVKTNLVKVLPGLARFRPIFDCNNKLMVQFKDSSIEAQSLLWNFGDGNTSTATNPTHLYSNFQNYTVSLTATNGDCTNTTLVNLATVDERPDFTASKTAICKQNSITLFLRNVQKANLSKYFWDFGDGTADSTGKDSIVHAYTRPGAYSITLTCVDIHGCVTSITKTDFIKVYSPVAAFSANSAGGCSDKALGFIDGSSVTYGTNNITNWVWDFGDGFTQSFGAPLPALVTHNYVAAGSYFPALFVTDSLGCRDSVSYAIPINIYKPTADFFAPNYATCMSDTVLFRNPSTGTRLSYLWNFGDGTTSALVTPGKRYSSNGNFTVKLVVTDAFGCTDSLAKANYVIVRDVVAAFNVSDSIGTCVPFQVRFANTSQGALSYRWNFGDGGLSSATNPAYSFNSAGLYQVRLTATRSANCVSNVTRQIKVSAPSGNFSFTPTNGCAPLDVAFNVSSPDKVSFIWDFGDGTSFPSADSAIIHLYTLPGQFSPKVILKDSSGCIVSLNSNDSVKIYSSKVDFGVSDSLVCGVQSIQFFDSTISGSPVSGYHWDFGDGTISTRQNPVHTYSQEGVYSIRFSISTSFGCTDTVYRQNYIRVVSPPSATIAADSSFCGPSTVRLTGNLLNPGADTYTWNWDFDNGNSSTLQAPAEQTFADTGIYNVRLVVANSSGCSDTVEKIIVVHPIPALVSGNDTTICEGSTAQLWASSMDANYTWSPANGINCVTCTTPVASISNDQWYYVTVTNRFGCINKDSVLITVKRPFRLSGFATIDSICAGDAKPLNVEGAEIYTWVPAVGLSNSSIPDPVANPQVTTLYKVIGSDSANCFRDSANITIKVNPLPAVNAGQDTTISSGRVVQLNPSYSTNIVSWLWAPPEALSCNDCPSPLAMPKKDVTYTVKVTSSGGCTATDQVSIRLSCDNSNVFIPTAFTPDGNGRNDVFVPNGIGIYRINSFRIFNREGVMVYLSGNFNAGERRMGWNGTYKGKPAPSGNYVYLVEYLCDNKKPVTIQGNILLIR